MSEERLKPHEVKLINNYMKGWTKYECLKGAGYSENVSKTNQGIMFRKPHIKKEIERRKQKMAERNELSEDWIIEQLMRVAGTSPGDLIEVGEDGQPRYNWNKLTPQLRKSIKKFSVDEYNEGRGDGASKVKSVKVETQDQLRALEMLMKVMGMDKQKVEHSFEETLINKLHEGRKRVSGEEKEEEADEAEE